MFVLKVLNGPLFGAEFALPADECFVRTVDPDLRTVVPEVERAVDVMSNLEVLTIPLPGSCPGFMLKPKGDAVYVEVFDRECEVAEWEAELNAPIVIGALRIALRHAKDTWSEAVLQDCRTPAIPVSQGDRRKSILAWAGMAVLAIGALAATWHLSPTSADDPVHHLASRHGVVMENAMGEPYVVAHSVEAAGVIRRTLQKSGSSPNVTVVTRQQIVEKIERVLDESGIRYFSVVLTDPRRPVLMLPAHLPSGVRSRLEGALAYAHELDVRLRTEQDAQRAAVDLVRELGLTANYSATPDRFTVSISDHLSDTQLDALGSALYAYRKHWGGRYVHFVINQRDLAQIDGIKVGRFGYELRGVRHLFFGEGVNGVM
ncbi:hypothetical protein PI93_019460 [Pandoraea fibrosis]|uniref:Type III secretion system protein PrgH/EprH n=1 Tax=Pandoraea fibrosis TaxID=1891094 RepID=A0ABX6HVQ6_9BURK|nr:PrgH/EprH family type III secretion apparatus protein [Pandoraea fibrosis]QHE91853.1 hypothetical protein PJ20_008540 [Pandoraea fibrosis]QHF14590.1 hypothetical protein PI93_019460 [Pandoraea fibrosis]